MAEPENDPREQSEFDTRVEKNSGRSGENPTRDERTGVELSWNQAEFMANYIALQELLKDKDKKIIELMERKTVQKLQEIHNGYPPMERNKAAKPSTIKNVTKNSNGKRNAEAEPENQPDAQQHRESKHDRAKIKALKNFNLSKIFGQFEVNYKTLEKGEERLVESLVAAELGKEWDLKGVELPNVNESTVSRHVRNIVVDAARCLGLESDKIRVETEMSFFSMRPDIVSVYYSCQIIFCVEVKNEGPDVMTNEEAAGQCLDYTYGLRNLGIDVPIVCLSTYSAMRIGSCKECIKDILKDTISRLQNVNENNPFCTTKEMEDQYEFPSPEMKGRLKSPRDVPPGVEEVKTPKNDSKAKQNHIFETPKKGSTNGEAAAAAHSSGGGDNSATIDDTQDEDKDAEMDFKAERSSLDNGNQTINKVPEEGDLVTGKWYNLVQVDSYSWRQITKPIKATFALKNAWRKDIKIYLREVLGTGSTGKVYLAMDSSGRHFAIKMMFFDSETMSNFDPNKNQENRIKQMEKLERRIAQEANRWKIIYPVYEKSIREMTLNGLPCFAMPYVGSIKMSERAKLIPKIRAEMKRILDLGYEYQRKDIRWRHIGLRCDKNEKDKVVFVDLESMKKQENNLTMKEKEAAVNFFISELEKKNQNKKP